MRAQIAPSCKTSSHPSSARRGQRSPRQGLFLEPLCIVKTSWALACLCTLIVGLLPPLALAQHSGLASGPIDRAYHGTYSESRQALHRSIIEIALRGVQSPARQPTLTFLAGPMASGKSSLLQGSSQHQNISPVGKSHVAIDIDAIRFQIPEFHSLNLVSPERAVVETQKEAGYIAELLLWEAIRLGHNIVFETSLRQTDFLTDLKRNISLYAKQYTGNTNLVFVFSDLASLKANAEVRNRIGQRQTPYRDVTDGYYLSMQNFLKIKSLFDKVAVIDNTPSVRSVVYVEHTVNDMRKSFGTSLPIGTISGAAVDIQSSYSAALIDSAIEQASRRSPNKGYDLYFDLDWTLFYGIKDPGEVEKSKLLKYSSGNEVAYFRLLDNTQWLIESLLDLKGVRIHFITGANRDRAEWLLSQIRIHNQTALSIASSVITKDQLLETSNDPNMKFTMRYGKYVQRWRPGIDMTRTLLIDDSIEFARFGLAVMNSHGKYNFHRQFSAERVGQVYEAPNEIEFLAERNRALLIYNVIAEAHRLDTNGKADFTAVASEALLDTDHQWKSLSDPTLRRYFVKPSDRLRAAKSCEGSFTHAYSDRGN